MFATVVPCCEFNEKEGEKRSHGVCRIVGAAMD